MRWHRRRVLLALLFTFEEEGRQETSLSEILEAVYELESRLRIGYRFVRGVFYSRELFQDIDAFVSRGYLDSYRYAHDAFVPKTFLKLTYLGRAEGKAMRDRLTDTERSWAIECVRLAIKRADARWKIFARVVARV